MLMALILWALIGGGVYFLSEKWDVRGQMGDMFGAANALFSALAFSGLLIAIFAQSRELRLQGEQLALQRVELELTRAEQARIANAQEQTRDAVITQAQILSLTAELSAFMAWDRSRHNLSDIAAFDELVTKLRAARDHAEMLANRAVHADARNSGARG